MDIMHQNLTQYLYAITTYYYPPRMYNFSDINLQCIYSSYSYNDSYLLSGFSYTMTMTAEH